MANPQDWTQHVDFVRALAARLSVDGHEADDVAQEAWTRALERPPRTEERVRGWLARVAQNALRQARRAARVRRAAPLSDHARRAPSTDELAAQVELNRRLAEAVFALQEPFRATLHQRYYCGLSAIEIARAEGLPVETVRTRIKRALAMLRARLDREYGDRNTWCVLLAPLAADPRGTAWTLTTGALMSTSGKIGLAAGVAVLIASAFAIREGSTPDATTPVASVELPPTRATPAEREAEVGIGAETGRVALPAEEADGASERVAGRLVVIDGNGEHDDRAGSFTLVSERPDGARTTVRIPVTGGRFTVEIDPRARLGIEDLEVEGEYAELERKPEREGDRVTLRARVGEEPAPAPVVEGTPLLLRVVDGRTGVELPAVTVLRNAGKWSNEEHPGGRTTTALAVDLPSPVRVVEQGMAVLWVHAPGFAWRHVQVDGALGGERTVQLEPGGELAVTTRGDAPPTGARVRVRRPGAPVFQYVVERELAAGESFLVGDLLPGDYEVLVQTGAGDATCTYGRAPVAVAAGTRAEVSVAIDRAAVPERVPLAGSLVLPATLRGEALTLRLRRDRDYTESLGQAEVVLETRDMQAVPGRPDELAWSAGEVLPGRYSATVPEIRFGARLSVPDDPPEVRIWVAAPVEVEVSFRDAASGAAVVPMWFGTCAGRFDGRRRNRNQVYGVDLRTDGTATVRAVPGELGITVRAEGYRKVDRAPVRLDAAGTPVVVELARAVGLRVSLEQGGAAVPAPTPYWNAVELDAPPGRTVEGGDIDRAGFEATWYVDGEGAYTLHLPELEGYAPVAPVEVHVGPDALAEVVVELTPAIRTGSR